MLAKVLPSQKQIDLFNKSVTDTLQSAKIVPHTRGSVFAENHFEISPEAKGATTGKFIPRVWQREILDVYASIEYEDVVWLKPSRTGASKIVCATLTQCAVQHKFNCLVFNPDDGDSDYFVKTEIDPILRDLDILQPLRMFGSKKFDTMNFKQLNGCLWQFLGGASPKHYRGRSVDLVILDELSGFAAQIGKDGDASFLAKIRITESPFGKRIRQSSPLALPHCQITAALKQCDFVFKFRAPCPGCEKEQYMDFYEDGSKGVRWDQETKGLTVSERAETACYRCEHCEKDFTYAKMQQACESGRWATDDGKHWLKKGRIYSKQGHRNEKRWAVGFQSNCFLSPAFTFEEFATEYLEAKRELAAGRDGPMKTVTNTRLGRATDPDSSVVNIDYRTIRRKNAMEYPDEMKIPAQVLGIVSPCDVQGDRIEVLDVGFAEGEESFALNHTVLPGDTNRPEVWEQLSRHWRERTYETADGRHLGIFLHGIDHGGHWTEQVEHFCREHGPREFLAIKGRLGVNEPVAQFPRRPTQSGCWLVINNTDTTKTTIMKRLAYERDEELWVNPGCINFPYPLDGYENFDERFYKQVVSETRIVSPTGKVEWKQSGLNEALDLLSMALCLIRVGQMPQYGLKLKNLGNVNADELDPYESVYRKKYDLTEIGRRLKQRSG